VSDHKTLLQVWQPAALGWADGSISSLAPIFAVAVATGDARTTFLVGLSTAIGAAVSMAAAEALSDTGELTGRGAPLRRGVVTGVFTFGGAIVHACPFAFGHFKSALILAAVLSVLELLLLAYVRWRVFQGVTFFGSAAQTIIAGAIALAVGLSLGGV
jgi:VIT1/CCC1 family predicted Fe2+/Mn2+ transporter